MGRRGTRGGKPCGARTKSYSLFSKDRLMTRKWLAGGLTPLICLFGLTASVAAASGSGKHQRRVDPKSVITGLDAPAYEGRKPGDHPKLDRTLNDRSNGGTNTSRVIIVLKPG